MKGCPCDLDARSNHEIYCGYCGSLACVPPWFDSEGQLIDEYNGLVWSDATDERRSVELRLLERGEPGIWPASKLLDRDGKPRLKHAKLVVDGHEVAGGKQTWNPDQNALVLSWPAAALSAFPHVLTLAYELLPQQNARELKSRKVNQTVGVFVRNVLRIHSRDPRVETGCPGRC